MLAERRNVVPEQMQDFFGDRGRLELRAFDADQPVMRLGGNFGLSLPANLHVKDQSRSGSLRDPGRNLDQVPFRDRLAEAAPNLHAREADVMAMENVRPGGPEGKKKLFFRDLKPSEEIAIVSYPCRVTVGPVNADVGFELLNRCLPSPCGRWPRWDRASLICCTLPIPWSLLPIAHSPLPTLAASLF